MSRPCLDIFIDVCRLPDQCKNKNLPKTDCYNAFSEAVIFEEEKIVKQEQGHGCDRCNCDLHRFQPNNVCRCQNKIWLKKIQYNNYENQALFVSVAIFNIKSNMQGSWQLHPPDRRWIIIVCFLVFFFMHENFFSLSKEAKIPLNNNFWNWLTCLWSSLSGQFKVNLTLFWFICPR